MSAPEWGADIAQRVFETGDQAKVLGLVHDWLTGQVGPCEDVHLIRSAMVSVYGATSKAHGRIVVRVHQPGVEPTDIARTARIQRHLATNGFPAARPLAAPAPIGTGWGVIEEHLSAGDQAEEGWGPEISTPLGAGLARIAVIGAGADTDALPAGTFRAEKFELVSHTSLFNFEGTRKGAEWIEEYGQRAHDLLMSVPAGASKAMHRDWRLGNVEVVDGRIVAAYDWGGLSRWPEAEAAGAAATGFGSWWDRGGRKGATAAEAGAFLAAYEDERGEPFSPEERTAASACAVTAVMYVARCEHSLGWDAHPDSAQAALARCAEELLTTGIPSAGVSRRGA